MKHWYARLGQKLGSGVQTTHSQRLQTWWFSCPLESDLEEFTRLGTESYQERTLFQLGRSIEQLTANHHDVAVASVRASFSDVALSGRSSGVAGQGGLPGAGGRREPTLCQVLCTVVSLVAQTIFPTWPPPCGWV